MTTPNHPIVKEIEEIEKELNLIKFDNVPKEEIIKQILAIRDNDLKKNFIYVQTYQRKQGKIEGALSVIKEEIEWLANLNGDLLSLRTKGDKIVPEKLLELKQLEQWLEMK